MNRRSKLYVPGCSSTPWSLGMGNLQPLMTGILISWVYKPLLLGWWVYPLLYGNNGSLDPIAHIGNYGLWVRHPDTSCDSLCFLLQFLVNFWGLGWVSKQYQKVFGCPGIGYVAHIIVQEGTSGILLAVDIAWSWVSSEVIGIRKLCRDRGIRLVDPHIHQGSFGRIPQS